MDRKESWTDRQEKGVWTDGQERELDIWTGKKVGLMDRQEGWTDRQE